MKAITKAIIFGIFRIAWTTLGVFLVALLLLAEIRGGTFSGSGALSSSADIGNLITITFYGLMVYLLVTIIFVLVRKLIRKHKEKKND
jgi:hypothetical protein